MHLNTFVKVKMSAPSHQLYPISSINATQQTFTELVIIAGNAVPLQILRYNIYV